MGHQDSSHSNGHKGDGHALLNHFSGKLWTIYVHFTSDDKPPLISAWVRVGVGAI